jgi:GNAT superfamily N-acetyltransferase
MQAVDVRLLAPDEIGLLRAIDRTEQLEIEYTVENGVLVSSRTEACVPPWDAIGSGDHSVSNLIAFCLPLLDGGAQLLGAFDRDAVVGMALVEPALRPGLGWLALLHVSSGRRRSGVGRELWRVAVAVARESGARAMYVSATPTGSAVGFYLGQGCQLAGPDEIVAELVELEPVDVQLVCRL